MSVIYIDLGAMDGRTVHDFLAGTSGMLDPALSSQCEEVHAFEIADYSNCWRRVDFLNPNVKITWHHGAVGTETGEVQWSSDENPEAYTVVKDNKHYDKALLQTVGCIDFAQWLQTNVSATDTVIVKMDIEGSEYGILDKLIDTGAIYLIDHLFVEWHDWLMPASYKARHDSIVERCPIAIGYWG